MIENNQERENKKRNKKLFPQKIKYQESQSQ